MTTRGPDDLNPFYLASLIERGLRAQQNEGSADARNAREARIARLRDALAGLVSGGINVGNRTPLKGTPAWVTLDVVRGGFASGALSAELPLHGEQRAQWQEALGQEEPTHAKVNAHFLSEQGLTSLGEMLSNGLYRVDVPEHAALLFVAWLMKNKLPDAAASVLSEIGPWMQRLRFYPTRAARVVQPGSVVHVESASETAARLKEKKPIVQVMRMNETLAVWNPMFDRMVALFVETVVGDVPAYALKDGKPVQSANGQPEITGGWPGGHINDDWRARAGAWLADFAEKRRTHVLAGWPDARKGNFAKLRRVLEVLVRDAATVPRTDLVAVRSILAAVFHKRGAPASERLQQLRAKQAEWAARPLMSDVSKAVADRLATFGDEGIPSVDVMREPRIGERIETTTLLTNASLAMLAPKLRRCVDGRVLDLVTNGTISSGEVLARVLPQLTGDIQGAAFEDAELRRLYGATYIAFRRRRSLLLLNLQSQVRFTELPWISAVEMLKRSDATPQNTATEMLRRVATVALTAFPQTIIPNKLLQEMTALSEAAGLPLPFVEELAADIFMGDFTGKFVRAAQVAARLLSGSLYERYFDVRYELVAKMDPQKSPSADFRDLCRARAGTAATNFVVNNGRCIEQQQVLTTQNLAVLFDALNLRDALVDQLVPMAQRCFAFVVSLFRQTRVRHHAALIRAKKAAYAWRQMIFFLSFVEQGKLLQFIANAETELGQQSSLFRERFAFAVAGLRVAATGERPLKALMGWDENHPLV